MWLITKFCSIKSGARRIINIKKIKVIIPYIKITKHVIDVIVHYVILIGSAAAFMMKCAGHSVPDLRPQGGVRGSKNE